MYRILCDGKIFYHPLLPDYQITDGVCEMEVNKAGTLSLKVPETNPHYSLPKLRISIIELFDDDELLFRGVPYSPSRNLYLDNELTIVGELFFFNDSIQLPFGEYFGSVETLFSKAIEYHNTQVDSWKQFKVGKVTVKNDTASGDIVRSSDHAMNTWDFIQEKFLKPLGGYLFIRHETDGIYIDYLADLNYQGNQEVKQCINLIDAEEVVNSDELATVLVPYGARIKDSEGNETDERVTIESVNSGKLGVENAKAIATYGRITKTVTYDDITEPLNLKKAAERDLALSIVSKTLEVKAADLSKAAQESAVKIESFRVGHKVPVKIERMGINQRMLIKHLTLDLFAPESTVLQIGNTAKDFTSLFTNFEKLPKDGKNGNPGQGVESITELFFITESKDASTLPAPTEWLTTAPEWKFGKYIWKRSKIIYKNPSKTEYTTPVCSSEWEAANKVQDSLEQVRTDFASDVKITEQSIIQTVSQSHYSKEESEKLIDSLSSSITQNAEGFEMRFNQLKAELEKANGTIVEQNKYIKFVDGEIVIGIEGCPLVAVHTNKALEFRYNGAVVGKFTNEGLYTRNVNVENRINMFGKWSICPGQNGNLNIKWIGGAR